MKQKLLHGADNQTVAVNSALKRDAEEGVVINILAAGTGFRSAQRSATGEDAGGGNSNSNDEKLFHNVDFLQNIFIRQTSNYLRPTTRPSP